MKSVQQLVLSNHRPIWTVSSDATVQDALALIEDIEVGRDPGWLNHMEVPTISPFA